MATIKWMIRERNVGKISRPGSSVRNVEKIACGISYKSEKRSHAGSGINQRKDRLGIAKKCELEKNESIPPRFAAQLGITTKSSATKYP